MTAQSLREQFDGLDGRVWLNCAHQGPLPVPAVREIREATDKKRSPWTLTNDDFDVVPPRLKEALGELIGAPPDDVILGNSTTYGLNLLAQGLPLAAGDEVLVVDGDFPATVFPWLPLRRRGVTVRMIKPALTAEELVAQFGPATKVFCSSWVFSFTGATLDHAGIAAACHAHGVTFVLNGAQGIGARPIDVRAAGVDALVGNGFKWLCGPYATGFCWIRPELRETLTLDQAYWLTHQTAGGVARTVDYELRDVGAAGYDVFNTANFLNFPAWTASIRMLLEYGIEKVAAYDQGLVQRLVDGLDEHGHDLLSPREGPARSTLVVLRHRTLSGGELHRRLGAAGVETALRDGNVRISPHVYNTTGDIDAALSAM